MLILDLFMCFEKEIFESFKETILANLCRDIETDLRFHIHAHLKVEIMFFIWSNR